MNLPRNLQVSDVKRALGLLEERDATRERCLFGHRGLAAR